jgi:hypothetical protein
VRKVYIHSDRTGSQNVCMKLPEQSSFARKELSTRMGGVGSGAKLKKEQRTSPDMKSKYV